jgi:hypothetical protein
LYAKPYGSNTEFGFGIQVSGGAVFAGTFTLTGNGSSTTGFPATSGIGPSAADSTNITLLSNGWYKCEVKKALSVNSTAVFVMPQKTATPYSGTGTDGVYIWGVQLEQGSFPTSYIPTSGSTVTRQPDRAVITGTNFSNIYNSTEGTLYLEAKGKGVGNTGSNATFQVDNETSNNRITVINDDESTVSSLITVGGSQTNLNSTPSFTTGFNKNAIAYKSGDNASSLNGSTVVTSTSIVTLPVVDRFRLGSNAAGGNSNNTIRRAIYYPTRLTNSQLQSLTQ